MSFGNSPALRGVLRLFPKHPKSEEPPAIDLLSFKLMLLSQSDAAVSFEFSYPKNQRVAGTGAKSKKRKAPEPDAQEPSVVVLKAFYFFSVALVPFAFRVSFLVSLGSLGGVGVLQGLSVIVLTS